MELLHLLTATGNSDCASSYDELVLYIHKQPSVVISDTTLEHCETQPLILSNVTALHYDPNTVNGFQVWSRWIFC